MRPSHPETEGEKVHNSHNTTSEDLNEFVIGPVESRIMYDIELSEHRVATEEAHRHYKSKRS